MCVLKKGKSRSLLSAKIPYHRRACSALLACLVYLGGFSRIHAEDQIAEADNDSKEEAPSDIKSLRDALEKSGSTAKPSKNALQPSRKRSIPSMKTVMGQVRLARGQIGNQTSFSRKKCCAHCRRNLRKMNLPIF